MIPNIDFIFSKAYMNAIENKKSNIKMHEFIASLEYFHEVLLLIRDMASSSNEKMKNNATIL